MPQGNIQRRLQVFATSPSDPNFALGYRMVGGDYNALGQLGRAMEYSTRAFQYYNKISQRTERRGTTAVFAPRWTAKTDQRTRTGTKAEQINAVLANRGPQTLERSMK
jgi:hypothetical protein